MKCAVPHITPGLSPLASRWSSGKDACDCSGGFRPGDEELEPLPLHPHPQSFFLLRHQRAESLQHRRPAAARASQLLLQASLCQHHGGVRPGSRHVAIQDALSHTHTHKVIQICIHSYEHTLFWLSSGLLVRGSELWALNSVLGSELWVLTQGSKL